MSKLRKIIFSGLFLAASIVLSRFLAINTPIVSISFSFIPIILTAMLLGTSWAVLVSGLSDLLGALMFPFGAYFPGYTFSAILAGLIYGLFLHNAKNLSGKQFLWRLIVSCLLVSVICNLCLNTLWIYITTKKAVVVFGTTRLIKEAILVPIRIIVMQSFHLILKKANLYKKLNKNSIECEETEDDKV